MEELHVWLIKELHTSHLSDQQSQQKNFTHAQFGGKTSFTGYIIYCSLSSTNNNTSHSSVINN